MSKGQKTALAIVGVLVAAGIGAAVALLAGDNGEETAKTDTVATTQTTEPSTETSTQSTETTTVTGTTETQVTTNESSTTVTVDADAAAEVAVEYAEETLNVESFNAETVVKSKSNPEYAIVSGFVKGQPIAVWTKSSGGKTRALAGTKSASPAPKGKGIPDDIKFPFSETGPPSKPSKPSRPSVPSR